MEKISGNSENQKEGYEVGLKTVGIRAAVQLHIPPPPIFVLLLLKTGQQAEIGVTYAKPHVTKPRPHFHQFWLFPEIEF